MAVTFQLETKMKAKLIDAFSSSAIKVNANQWDVVNKITMQISNRIIAYYPQLHCGSCEWVSVGCKHQSDAADWYNGNWRHSAHKRKLKQLFIRNWSHCCVWYPRSTTLFAFKSKELRRNHTAFDCIITIWNNEQKLCRHFDRIVVTFISIF